MKRIPFNNTQLVVSRLSLGTAQYGTGVKREDAFAQMNLYAEEGGNLIDTAHVYGDWGSDRKGVSEIVIGEWMKERRNRHDMIVVSKGCHPPLSDMLFSRVYPKELAQDVEESLSNFQSDYIDLYLFHRDNTKVPAGELIEAMEEQVRKGNLRYYGCSNWSVERIREAQEYAKAHGLTGFVCNQTMSTLADVVPETLLAPQLTVLDEETYTYQKETGLNLMSYMAMAGGYFSRILSGRENYASLKERHNSVSNVRIAERLKELVKEGYSVPAVMFAYVTRLACPAVPVAGFSSMEQLADGIAGIEQEIPGQVIRELAELKQLQRY